MPCEQACSNDIPPTPELGYASLTATPTSAQPVTPMHMAMLPLKNPDSHIEARYGHEQFASEDDANESEGHTKREDDCEREPSFERVVDPRTVFVGGLEAFGPTIWDETRLRAVFERYGEVNDVRIINTCEPFESLAYDPTHVFQAGKKTFFAFVTFADMESPLKAIRAEVSKSLLRNACLH